MKKASELTEAGYYWWLPECEVVSSDKSESWVIRMWHPLDDTRPKSGRFVGPLMPPIAAQTADRAAGGECCEWAMDFDKFRTRAWRKTSCGATHHHPMDCFKLCPYCGRPIHVKES